MLSASDTFPGGAVKFKPQNQPLNADCQAGSLWFD